MRGKTKGNMQVKSHSDFIDYWAGYIKTQPRSVWKPQLDEFIDSQLGIANRFWRNLEKRKGRKAMEKVIEHVFNL